MIKKIINLAMIVVAGVFSMSAQQVPAMPENPNVKHGTLPNGLNYYIMHNEEPKERANFYIAQKVGSTLETPDQLGLAHFLEHMAFNGTKNYPGKAMLNYLQSKGIRFGADINAYTSFDETVYNINNVPTSDTALVDSVLLALHDWSCELSLTTEEINAERGVIQEEWRMRDDAQNRMFSAMLPALYEEYQYRQMPIGTMEVVMNFDPDVLRAYYHKWYRPDQQGIIIVGDIDVDVMESKVKEMFSSIPMPENAAERTYPTVSDNKEPIYFEFQDPELTYTMARLSFKSEKTPFELRNTQVGFVKDDLLPSIISRLINNRIEDFSKEADCKYAEAGVYFGDYYVSKTKDSFNVAVIAKDDVKGAFSQVMGIVARACKTGFTQSEYDRVKDEITAEYDKKFNERNNTKSGVLAKELIRHFIDNVPAPGIEIEKQMVDAMLVSIPVAAINEVCTQLLTTENQVLAVSSPSSTGPLPGRDAMLAEVNNAMNAQYEAYVDEVITDPLITNYRKPGKVISTATKEYGTTEMTLSNGVKVIVKTTDFKADQVLMTAYRNGGRQTFAADQGANLDMLEDAFETARIGNFDRKTLTKYLAGKNVSFSNGMGIYTYSFKGSSNVKDLEYLMDLTYASFTAMGDDKEAYDVSMSKLRPQLVNMELNPQFQFQIHQMKAIYGNNPLMQPLTAATIDKADYAQMMSILRDQVANAADYTFIFVGNVTAETLKPMLEKYIASLPSKKKTSKTKVVTPIAVAKGNVADEFTVEMSTPSTMIVDIYNGYAPYTVAGDIEVSIMGEIMSNIFTETLREEEGGSYSPYAFAHYNPVTNQWMLYEVVQTNAELQDKMLARANAETVKLLKEGAKPEAFAKVKEATLKQYEISERTNEYWLDGLFSLQRGFNTIEGRRAAIENLTLEKFNKYLSTLWNGENRVKIVMTGVKKN